MKHVVVAGATSFLARHLLPLLAGKANVIGLVRRGRMGDCSNVTYIPLELEEYDQFSMHVSRCDAYLPLVWAGTKRKARNDAQINESSFHAVMKSVRQAIDMGCKKIIIPGTCAEFSSDGRPIDEKTPCRPQSPYGYWKHQLVVETEKLCKERAVRFYCLRMFSVYGADDAPDKMLNAIWKQLVSNETICMTEGWQVWSFLHVDDAARAFAMTVLNDGLPEGCYNLAAEEHRTLRDFVEEMRVVANSSSEIHYGAIPYTGTIPHTIFLSRKMGRKFPWSPEIRFSEGIRNMQK